MSRRAVELSLNTIIIASIVLLVLIVLIIIFTGQSGKFTRGLNDCKARGGIWDNCKLNEARCIDAGGMPSGPCIFYDEKGNVLTDQSNKDLVCCVFKK